MKKKTWLWIGGVVLVLAIVGALSGPKEESKAVAASSQNEEPTNAKNTSSEPTKKAEATGSEAETSAGSNPGTLDQAGAEKVVQESLSSIFIEKVSVSGNSAEISLKENNSDPLYEDYFTTGDKANKIFAVESVRWFRDLPALEDLTLRISHSGQNPTLHVTREDIEKHYGISLDDLAADQSHDKWRSEFSSIHDNKEDRAKFVSAFVK